MIVSPKIYTGVVPKPACVALGMFDGLHIGHQAVINCTVQEARRTGASACVFTFDPLLAKPDSKKGNLGRVLSQTAWERQLQHWGVEYALCVDFAEYRDLSPEAFVKDVLVHKLQAQFVACGEDFHFGKRAAASAQDLKRLGKQYGVHVQVIPTVYAANQPVSTTRIRECIQRGDMATTEKLLGRRYSIDFTVIPGRKLGRLLDCPTINQPYPDDFVVPRFGVYATVAMVEKQARIAVTNVGVKPTVGSDRVLAETYILDYTGDLYGKNIEVKFLQAIRPEKKFDSLDALREQILNDSQTAIAIAQRLGV